MVGFDTHAVLGGVVLDQQLLQKEESLSLLCFLADLDKAVPVMEYWRFQLHLTLKERLTSGP